MKRRENLASSHENLQERERTRIARDIHDELGQHMTGMRLALGTVKRRVLEPEREGRSPAALFYRAFARKRDRRAPPGNALPVPAPGPAA